MCASFGFAGFANADPPYPRLPKQPVTATVSWYENLPDIIDIMAILSNVPSGYDVVDGVYTGWCVDKLGIYVYSDDLVYLYSSLNVPNVDQLDMRDWNRINYVLNNVAPGATSADIQQAIWAFETIGGGAYTPTRPLALAMVADALANGGDFVPTRGEYVAVILYPADPEACESAHRQAAVRAERGADHVQRLALHGRQPVGQPGTPRLRGPGREDRPG